MGQNFDTEFELEQDFSHGESCQFIIIGGAAEKEGIGCNCCN
jgi:hypothetical protein